MGNLNWDSVDVDDASLAKYFVNDSGGRNVIIYHSEGGDDGSGPFSLSTFPPFFKDEGSGGGALSPDEMTENSSITNSTMTTLLDILNGTSDNVTKSGPRDELYDVPLSIIILLSLLYGGISIAALIGNVLVLWVVTVSWFAYQFNSIQSNLIQVLEVLCSYKPNNSNNTNKPIKPS